MFACGECGRKFADVEECWTHVERCGEPTTEEGRRVPCPDCKGTGARWRHRGGDLYGDWEDCPECDGTGKVLRFCLKCWDSGLIGWGKPVHDLPSCDCDAGQEVKASRVAGLGIYSREYLARMGRPYPAKLI